MVTGTNGKTTTTRIIGKVLEENNIEYITNKSGANLVSGIITTFIESVNIFGKSKTSTALLEVDEAAFNVVTDYVQPDVLVVTNFFRDQLDRYGELYTTVSNVRSLCASLGHNMDREAIYYGFSEEAYNNSSTVVNSDASICLYCKSKYEYSYNVYGHLGELRIYAT